MAVGRHIDQAVISAHQTVIPIHCEQQSDHHVRVLYLLRGSLLLRAPLTRHPASALSIPLAVNTPAPPDATTSSSSLAVVNKNYPLSLI
jgi:hypothetical protein